MVPILLSSLRREVSVSRSPPSSPESNTHRHTQTRTHTCRARVTVDAGEEAKLTLQVAAALEVGLPKNESLVAVAQELWQ